MQRIFSKFSAYVALMCCFSLCLFISACTEETPEDPFAATASITTSMATVTEGGNSPEITVSLNTDNTSGGGLTIRYTISGTAAAGSDYTAASGSVTIADGDTEASFSVAILDDEEVEERETIIITLDSSGQPEGVSIGNTNSITITLQDNDEEDQNTTPNEISISASATEVTEAGTNPIITFELSATLASETSFEYRINGTAENGTDYTELSGNITLASGTQSGTLEIALIDDQEVEQDETITIAINGMSLPSGFAVGDTREVTLTVKDNDEATTPITLTFDASDGNSITVGSWTEVSNAAGYLIFINDENNFESISASATASTTYAGTGLQAVYNTQNSEKFTATLLQDQTTYYFKVVPYYADGTFDNTQDASEASTMSCSADSDTESEICLTILESDDLRNIVSNQFPNHETGRFPNADVTATANNVNVDLTPTNTGQVILVYNETGGPTPSNQTFYKFGIASNGLGYNPMGLKPWTNPNTGEENWEWQAAVVNEGDTDLDAFGGHVTSQGMYHYHGDIIGLAAGEDGSKHSLLYGWAADGFPIYYKYGYATSDNPNSGIKELKSSYQLKSGDRGGDGTTAPNGTHDGTYIQDYEYVEGLGDLDACNGRMGVTPEYPNGTYYYVITADFPKVPNCFVGTPSEDFLIGR